MKEEDRLLIVSAKEALTTKSINISNYAKTSDEIRILEKKEYIEKKYLKVRLNGDVGTYKNLIQACKEILQIIDTYKNSKKYN